VITIRRGDVDGKSYFSTVSFRFFSEASSSSSKSSTFLERESFVDPAPSELETAFFKSVTMASLLSREVSASPRRCSRDLTSCSLWRSSCSSFLFFASASSARAMALSASTRRPLSFYAG
jgi:hypothetical protein